MASKPEKLSWQPGSYSMEYIARNFWHHLPQVVQCDHTVCGSGEESEDVGCGPPLLLYSLSNLPRAVGVKLVEDEGQGKALKVTKEHFLIPFEYKGWFILSGPKPKHGDVPVYNAVSAVFEADCEYFVIGGNKKLDILRKMASAHTYAPSLAYPGEKLKVMEVVQQEKTYLQCMDETNQVILIDYESKGVFYMISNKNTNTKVNVVQMKDIISNHQNKLPCVVKLLLGKGPLQDSSFTGWLKLSSLEKVPTVLASTVTIAENGLLEVPRCSQLKYRIATLNTGWKEYAGYKEALRLCRRFAEEYSRSIKPLTVKITSASVLRGVVQSGVPGQIQLDATVRKGCAPGMTKTRHFYPVAVNTIFESEFEDGHAAETENVDEIHGDYEMLHRGNVNDREYENVSEVFQQNDHAAYAHLTPNPGPASDTIYNPIQAVAEIHSTDQSSLILPQADPATTIYANEDCIKELKQEHVSEREHGQMKVADLVSFFNHVMTENINDSPHFSNVDDMAPDEHATMNGTPKSHSTPDYINVPDLLE